MSATIQIPYGGKNLQAVLDESRVMAVLSADGGSASDESALIRGAFRNPLASNSFEAFLSGPGGLLVIVNDADRDNAAAPVLDAVGGALEGLDARFLVATGSHPAPTETDLRTIFGRHLERWRSRIAVHDARDAASHVPVGTTPRGTTVALHRWVTEASRIFVIGSVEPHYFAGFTGGRKSFVPGCAAFETIEGNHRHALEPESRVLALEGNPVHEDLMDAFRCLAPKPLFALQAVFDRGGRICAAFAGGLEAAFRRAVESSRAAHCVPVPGPADVIVAAVTPPLDVNLYQAHKAAENARPVLAPGGIFILVAPCRQGVGNDAFVRLLSSETDPRRVEAAARAGYRLGFHKSARIASFVQTAQFWAVTELPAGVLRPLFVRPFAGLQEALDEALRQKPQGRFLIVQSAGTTVPFPAPAFESPNPRVP